jgi:hypothetical protein
LRFKTILASQTTWDSNGAFSRIVIPIKHYLSGSLCNASENRFVIVLLNQVASQTHKNAQPASWLYGLAGYIDEFIGTFR